MSSTNHITKVAIVGATGRIGKHFAAALIKTGKHTVTALSRSDSTGTLPEGINVAHVDYADENSIISALEGQQFLVISLGARVPEDVHTRIVSAGGKAGVAYIMPNLYGTDIFDESLGKANTLGPVYKQRVNEVKESGSAYIAMICGFWYQWSLALGESWFGFDIKNKKVTFIDDGETKISISTWNQCGRALAALLSLPESGASPCLADYKNKGLYFSSFKLNQRDMLDSIHRVTGSTDADWTITKEPHLQRYNDGQEERKGGKVTGFAKVLYTATFFPNGGGDFEHKGLQNEVLGLPKEDLDAATKDAIQMVESGWNPFT